MKFRNPFARRHPAVEELVSPECDEALTGELCSIPLVEDENGELMLTRAQAEAFLDSVSLSWRAHGEVSGVRIAGETLYSKTDLVKWLKGG